MTQSGKTKQKSGGEYVLQKREGKLLSSLRFINTVITKRSTMHLLLGCLASLSLLGNVPPAPTGRTRNESGVTISSLPLVCGFSHPAVLGFLS